MYTVITGATKGIGRATAEKFAEEGSDLLLAARTERDLQQLQQQLQEQNEGIEVYVKSADLSNKEDVFGLAEAIQKQGKVDVLINNVGIFKQGPLLQEPEGGLEEIMDINLYSTHYLTQALIEDIKLQEGHIINLCSTASVKAYANGGAYCVAKHALLGMTRVFREELKPHNVKVTALIPGATSTDSWKKADIPEERFMPPEDVAEAIWAAYNMSERTNVESIKMRPQGGDIH
jgi:short-subunit dehydrogenase